MLDSAHPEIWILEGAGKKPGAMAYPTFLACLRPAARDGDNRVGRTEGAFGALLELDWGRTVIAFWAVDRNSGVLETELSGTALACQVCPKGHSKGDNVSVRGKSGTLQGDICRISGGNRYCNATQSNHAIRSDRQGPAAVLHNKIKKFLSL